MRTFLAWVAAFAIGLVVLVGLIAFINSRDKSGVDQQAAGPGRPYNGRPALSKGLRAALELGNVVVLYRGPKLPAGTQALVPPGGKPMVAAGQSVVIGRDTSLKAPLVAIASKRVDQATTAQELKPFVQYWLANG